MNENKSRHRLHLFASVYMLNSNTLTQIKGLMDTYRMPPFSTPPHQCYHGTHLAQCSHVIMLQPDNSVYNRSMGTVTYLKSVPTIIFFLNFYVASLSGHRYSAPTLLGV